SASAHSARSARPHCSAGRRTPPPPAGCAVALAALAPRGADRSQSAPHSGPAPRPSLWPTILLGLIDPLFGRHIAQAASRLYGARGPLLDAYLRALAVGLLDVARH